MKKNLSALEIYYLIAEWEYLLGAKLDKIYQPSHSVFIFQFHVTGKGKTLLRIELPNYAFLTASKEEHPAEITGFCALLRKHLEQARLRSITQLGSERIIELRFEKAEAFRLYLEFFSPGNVVLCRDDRTIIAALESKKWKDRTIRGGIPYSHPQRAMNFFALTMKELAALTQHTERDSLVTFLALDLGLGGVYSEEACLRAGIDKTTKPAEMTRQELAVMLSAITALCNESIAATAVSDVTGIIDIVPFPLQKYHGMQHQAFPSFNEALDASAARLAAVSASPAASRLAQEQEKLAVILAEQERQIAALEQAARENTAKAELIYTHYPAMQDILSKLAAARKSHSLKEAKDELNRRFRPGIVITGITEKDGTATLEIDDAKK